MAAEWMGWYNAFHCEWNPFGQKILKYYWPNAISYNDITKTDFTIHRGQIDILTGGFPCQPYSMAGKRLGKEDDRHLWPEMLRAIREIQPRFVVGENVSGLVNWNGGMVFEEVQVEMENEGYQVTPFILPAAGVGAPHRRDRVWFVAYRNGIGCDNGSDNRQERPIHNDQQRNTAQGQSERTERKCGVREICSNGFTPDTGLQRPEIGQQQPMGTKQLCKEWNATDTDSRRQSSKEHREKKSRFPSEKSVSNYWSDFPTQSPVCFGDDGISTRLDGVTFPKWRNESIKAAGNAIVPQVALQIFKAIKEFD